MAQAGPLDVSDSFDQAKHPARKTLRGDYQFEDGVLKVGHDPALYKKYKDHGPIVIYDGAFQNAEVKMKFRLTQAANVDKPARGAFTFDGESGHVVRIFTMTNQPGRVIVWKEGDKKPTVVAKDLPAVKPGEWTELIVSINGERGTATLAGKTVQFEHAAVARPKTNAKYSTAFATMEIDEISIRGE